MAEDNKIKIVATLDGAAAEAGLARLADQTEKSMRKAASATKELADASKEVGKQSKISAEQVASIAQAFGGMAIGVAGAWARSAGYEKEAGYLDRGASGAFSGAMALSKFGPYGALAGGGLGMASGLATEYFNQAAEERRELERKQEQKSANLEIIASYDAVRAEAQRFAGVMDRLADVTRNLADRQKELEEESQRLAERESAAREAFEESNSRYDFKGAANAFDELRRINSEQDRIKQLQRALARQNDEDDDEEWFQPSAPRDVDALTKLGIFAHRRDGVSDLQSSFERSSLSLQRQQLSALQNIARGMSSYLFNASVFM